MNQRPIEQARDADMRFTVAAMNRAAFCAREIAIETGTSLVVSRDGKVQNIDPGQKHLGAVNVSMPLQRTTNCG